MAAAALAQCRRASAAERIVLDRDPGPVLDRAAQTHGTGLAHHDNAAFAGYICRTQLHLIYRNLLDCLQEIDADALDSP
jgi:hypothetical protein